MQRVIVNTKQNSVVASYSFHNFDTFIWKTLTRKPDDHLIENSSSTKRKIFPFRESVKT